jgi:hypothetical protein
MIEYSADFPIAEVLHEEITTMQYTIQGELAQVAWPPLPRQLIMTFKPLPVAAVFSLAAKVCL